MEVDEFIDRCVQEVEPDLGRWSNTVSWQGSEPWRIQTVSGEVVVFHADEVYILDRNVYAKCHTLWVNDTDGDFVYQDVHKFDPPKWHHVAFAGTWLLCGPQSFFDFSTEPAPLEAIGAVIEVADLEEKYRDS